MSYSIKDFQTKLNDQDVPYFSYDRNLTVAQVKERISTDTREGLDTIAWIMREARPSDVWQFISPKETYRVLPQLRLKLGRVRPMWDYLFRTWHELGRI